MTEDKKCDGHCENCTINQRTYCAAQMAYYNQNEISQIKAIVASLTTSDDKNIIIKDKVQEKADKEVVEEILDIKE